MEWAIITIYTSKCSQMDPQQLPKTPKFYSRSKKCDIEKTLGDGYHPLGSPKVKREAYAAVLSKKAVTAFFDFLSLHHSRYCIPALHIHVAIIGRSGRCGRSTV